MVGNTAVAAANAAIKFNSSQFMVSWPLCFFIFHDISWVKNYNND